jgi:hypothetical protein
MPINRTQESERWYDPTSLVDRVEKQEVVKCKCGCTYLEQVPVHQFPKLHNVILGQQVQPHRGITFYVFRCIKCNEVYEPSVQLTARDAARKVYDEFLDEMEGAETDEAPAEKSDAEVI